MTSLARFRTVLPFMTAIYSKATSDERTISLQEGILRISELVNPKTAEEWTLVRQDADRLLRLWGVKESDPAATEMATQLIGMIDSFTIDSILAGPEDVGLVIEEKEAPATATATAPPPAVPVSSVNSFCASTLNPFVLFDEEPPSNVKVVVIHETPASALDAEELEDADNEGEDNEDNEDNEDEEPSGCLAISTSLDVEDEEDDEDDNDGVEVQKIFFKGRSYWLGSDNKIYACADDDEIGEEIGDYNPAEKKPRFY